MGADMSRPMEIDFVVAVPMREAGEAVARLAAHSGYRTELVHDEEDDEWVCYCRTVMLLTYSRIVAAQCELDELSRPFGGRSDGWGTFGDPIDA